MNVLRLISQLIGIETLRLTNCTTQEYLVNVGQDSHFNNGVQCVW